jgi:outer membrane lipoprotein
MMKHGLKTYLALLAAMWFVSCSVMPAAVRQEALTDVPFPELVANASDYVGQTVILGGYVVEVQNEENLSRIVAVQAPLRFGDEPGSRDQSQGRLIIEYDGFLDPEVYRKDRRITVGGTLLGSSRTESGRAIYPYVRVKAATIHIWEQRPAVQRDPFWYRPYAYPHPFFYPWGWPYPYRW